MRLPVLIPRGPVLGFAGSCLIALGAAGAGVFPRPDPLAGTAPFAQLRSPAGSAACIAVAALGMLALVMGWLALRRDLPDPRRLRRIALAWAIPLALAPPILSRDIYAYAAVGDLTTHGMNPYAHGDADLPSQWLTSTSSSWYHVPFAYGPLFVLACHLVVAASGSHLVVALFGMRLVAILGCVLLAVFLPTLARACGVDERAALWLGLLNPVVLVNFVGGGHADSLMAGLLVAGVALMARAQVSPIGRRALATAIAGVALCTLAIAVKGTAALVLPFLVLLWPARGRGRARLGSAIGAVAVVAGVVFAATTAVSGVGYGWVTNVNQVGLSIQWTSVSTGVGLAAARLAALFGSPGHTAAILPVTRALGELAAAVIMVVLWWRAYRRPGVRAVVLASGWALLTLVLLSPAVHPWYLPWASVVLAGAGVAGRARTVVVIGSVVTSFLVLPNGYDLARATEPAGAALDAIVVLVAAAWAVHRWRTRPPLPDLPAAGNQRRSADRVA